MKTRCIDVDRIAEVLKLPADHSQRRHVDACPRCRSLADSYRSFIAAKPTKESGLDEVISVLDAHIDRDAARWNPAESHRLSLSRVRWWQGFLRPAPLAAAAAVAVLAVWWMARAPEESILRDQTPPSQAVIVLHEAQVRSDGDIFLSWDPVPGADRYQVRIYRSDLHELYRSPDVIDAALLVSRSAFPADMPNALDLTWEVYARHGADIIAVSSPGSIRVP